MPTIALVNGHCFGAGVFVAFAHDYRFQNTSKGFICLPEVDLGVVIPIPMQQMFKQKLPNPAVYRAMVLEGRRIAGKDALEMGIVDGLGGLDEALAYTEKWKLISKAEKGVWGDLKDGMYKETLNSLDAGGPQESLRWREKLDERREEEITKAREKVEDFLRASKAKL